MPHRNTPSPEGRSPPPSLPSVAGEMLLLTACDQPTPRWMRRIEIPCAATGRVAWSQAEVAAQIASRMPEWLVFDVSLSAACGPEWLRVVRHALPVEHWLLMWEEPSLRWLDTIIALRARGAIRRDTTALELQRALRMMQHGELWLPRGIQMALYESLLDLAAPLEKAEPYIGLTPREAEVMESMRQGLTNKEISARLGISVNTVKKHLASAFDKRHIKSRRQALG